MSKKNEVEVPEVAGEVSAVNPDAKVTLSLAELQQLLATTNSNNTDTVLSKLAQSLDNLRKPYEDPAQELNKAAARAAMREQIRRQKEELEIDRNNCPHIQGCNSLSDKMGDMTSIIHHTLDTGEMIGLCTVCQKVFRSDDPEYQRVMRAKSGNRPSAAGRRFFADPLKAIAQGRS